MLMQLKFRRTALKSWQTTWNCEFHFVCRDFTGIYTRQLIPEVGVKIYFPEERDTVLEFLIVVSCYMTVCLWMMLTELSCRTHQSDSLYFVADTRKSVAQPDFCFGWGTYCKRHTPLIFGLIPSYSSQECQFPYLLIS